MFSVNLKCKTKEPSQILKHVQNVFKLSNMVIDCTPLYGPLLCGV